MKRNSFKMKILKLILKKIKVMHNEWASLILTERKWTAYGYFVDMQSNDTNHMRPKIEFGLIQLGKPSVSFICKSIA